MKGCRFDFEEEISEESHLNLTPLLDVVFVVLISFILIAPILDIDQVDLASGLTDKQKHSMSPEKAPLLITVRADNTIWMQGRKVSFNELETMLLSQKKAFPGKTPQVVHDRAASFGTYQSVKTVLERCGFEQMDIVLKPG